MRQRASEKAVEEATVEGDKQPLESTSEGMEPAYAALRTLLELECEWQGKDRGQWKKRRSQQPFALLCQRSPSSLPLAVSEAFRWISIWGVRNPWGAAARAETPRHHRPLRRTAGPREHLFRRSGPTTRRPSRCRGLHPAPVARPLATLSSRNASTR